MSVIKQISIFNGSNWDTPADIGANAENIDFTYTTGSQQGNTAALSSILPAQALTASRVLVTDSNGKLSSSSISSGILNTALSGASTTTSLQSQINTLNTKLPNPNRAMQYLGYVPTNGDLNNYYDMSGYLYISNPSGVSNMPTDGSYSYTNLLVLGNQNYTTQMFITIGGKNVFAYREYLGYPSRWTQWKYIGNFLGTYTKVSGTYTTASWASGTRTATWKAPYPGVYLCYMTIGLSTGQQTAENRKSYKQIQVAGTASRILPNAVEYDTDNNVDTPNILRTISFPINCSQANQTVYPYIHTNKANVVYDYTIVGVKI